MHDRLSSVLAANGGVITVAEAGAIGISRNGLRDLVRAKVLTTVARGAYVDGALYAAATTPDQHTLRLRAIVRTRPAGTVVASHHSAVMQHGIPVHNGLAEGPVHLTRRQPGGTSRRHDAFTVHRCSTAPEVVDVAGVPTVTVADAVVGSTCLAGMNAGFIAADAALHGKAVTRADLVDAARRVAGLPGSPVARRVAVEACDLVESPGESLARLDLLELGYVVIPQFRILDRGGAFVARVDFYLPEVGVVVEFDGAVKYEGAQGRAALVAEKVREDAIRALGYAVVRVMWRELGKVDLLRRRVELAALVSTHGRRGRPA